MPVGKHVEQHIKDEIMLKIRDGGMRVVDAAAQYGISDKTIYAWLRSGVVDGNRNLILELNKLRKENDQLYRLLGRATAELHRPKG